MFKKLKDKIAEEVKSSPQRVQQLAQGVQAAVQNATASLSQDEDNNSPEKADRDDSFINVSLQNTSSPSHKRRLSNSSFTSDISFLPSFESHATLYHLQSDLDASASEIEDSYSGQLERVSKEQLLQTFRRMQMKYNKYRGRYTDLANHYRVLEKENVRVKSVLVETQDKALRRVSELKEQCSLEQSAKAHMENVLREDLNEKQYLIDTLNTKVRLLQHPSVTDKLVSLESCSDPQSQLLQEENATLKQQLEDMEFKLKEHMEKVHKLEEDFKLKVTEHNDIIAGLNDSLHSKDIQINNNNDIIKQLEATRNEIQQNNNKLVNDEQVRMQAYEKLIQEKDTLINNLNEDIQYNEKKLKEENKNITKLKQLISEKEAKIIILNENMQSVKEELLNRTTTTEAHQELNTKQIISLQETLREKENEIIKLKLDVENSNKERNEKIAEKENIITKLNQDITNLNMEYQNYKQQNILDVEKLNNELMNKSKENIVEITKLSQLLKNKNTELIELESRVQEHANKIKEKDEEITNFQKKIEELKKGHKNKDKATNEFKQKYEKELDEKEKYLEEITILKKSESEQTSMLSDKLKNVQEEHNKQECEFLKYKKDFSRIEESYKQKIVSIQHQMETVRKQLEESNEEKNILIEKIKEHDKLIKELNTNNADKDKELSIITKIKEELNVENSKLNTIMNEIEKRKEELEVNVEKATDTLNIELNKSQQLISIVNDLEKVTKELVQVQDKFNERESIIKEKEKEINKLREELKEYQEETSLLQRTLEKDKDLSSDKDIQYNNVLVENNKLKTFIEDLQTAMNTSEKEMPETINRLNETLQEKQHVDQKTRKKLEEENVNLEKQIEEITRENKTMNEDIQRMKQTLEADRLQLSELKQINDSFNAEKEKNVELLVEIADVKRDLLDANTREQSTCDELTTLRAKLQDTELELDKGDLRQDGSDLIQVNNELKAMKISLNETKKEKELLENSLKAAINEHTNGNNNNVMLDVSFYKNEISELEDKIALYENMEVTAKQSVQYLENELEKMKNNNEKLKCKLDETLVTLNHCADLSQTTEMEYLRNILYNYMIGKESIVLARVIAAVCKFDSTQTEMVLQKEHQKQTLLGQLGIL